MNIRQTIRHLPGLDWAIDHYPEIISMVWSLALFYPASTILDSDANLGWKMLGLAALGVFTVLYVYVIWWLAMENVRTPVLGFPLPWWITAYTILTGIGLSLALGSSGLLLMIFASASAGATLPAREGLRAVTLITVAAIVLTIITGNQLGDWMTTMSVLGVGFLLTTWQRLITAIRELEVARTEIAYLAVAEERARFARDLHDLLGHSLSLIALKSELAGRLTATDPVRASSEIGDVERVARTALQEVREAVAGYRQPTLATELQAAREILAAAGIACSISGGNLELSADEEAVLAWTIREGVTNVIRHSRARHCTIRVNRLAGMAQVEVIDDGEGGMLSEQTTGNGLRGLAERVAALGGQFTSGVLESGGFRLAVSVPLTTAASSSLT